MANSLFQQLNGVQNNKPQLNRQAIRQIKQMMKTVQGAKNPQAMMMQMAQNNPALAGIMQQIKGGVNPEQLFRQRATQMGLNPDEVVKALKS